MTPATAGWIRSHDLEIDLARQMVFRGDALIAMTPLTYQCLIALIETAPEVASSETLIGTLWPDRVVNDDTLTQRIALLRNDLGGEDREAYVQSVRSRGYRWRHPVDAMVQATGQTSPAPRPAWQTGLIVIALLTGCVLLATLWKQTVAHRRAADDPEISETQLSSDPASQLIEQAGFYYQRLTAEGTDIAIDLYRQAIALDPDGLAAITGLSQSLSQSVTKFNAPHSWLDEAIALADRAIALAPDQSRSWWVMGYARDAQGRIRAAIEHYRQALELDPENAGYIGSLAYLLAQSGQLVEAMRLNLLAYPGNIPYRTMQIAETFELLGWPVLAEQWYQRADQLNPDSVFAGLGRARFLFGQRRFAEANRVIDRVLDAGVHRPELHCLRGQMAVLEDRLDAAASQFERARQIDAQTPCGPVWLYWLATRSSTPALPDDLETLLDNTRAGEDIWPTQYIHAAMIRMAQNRPSDALLLLEAGVDAGFRQADLLMQSPAFKSLGPRPAFNQLIQSIREDVHRQRQQLLGSDWLPEDFLQPLRSQGPSD